MKCKRIFILSLLVLLTACSVNPATGDKQFTALMSPSQEMRVGADEHQKVIRTFGAPRPDDPAQRYVEQVGARVAANTERGDVTYKFFLLDSPMINAFALPGGYIYVTRGILATANSEAELAAVLAHEIGHITARHSAERYSHGVLTSLGAMVVAAAANSADAARVAGLGSQLYMSSYSRGQESQADDLGIRYLHRAGYDTKAMAEFLEALSTDEALRNRISGNGGTDGFDYFATHPRTADRVGQALAIAAQYPGGKGEQGRDRYLSAIDGITYGDSEKQGFARGRDFYHPAMGFMFSVPQGFSIDNQPEQVVAVSKGGGAAILFDAVSVKGAPDPLTYLRQGWIKDAPYKDAESITVSGMRAATASFPGKVSNRPVTIRVVAVEWAQGRFFRFQLAIPQGASADLLEDMKRTTYSLRRMTDEEKAKIRAYRLKIVTAAEGDTVESLAARMPFDDYRAERFMALNGMRPGQKVAAGQEYKMIATH